MAVPRRKRRSAAHASSLAEEKPDEAVGTAALAWGRKRRRNHGWADIHIQVALEAHERLISESKQLMVLPTSTFG